MAIDTSKSQKRKPRFRRVSTLRFVLQDRDIEIIRQVYKHRFLNSRHIQALTPGSDKWILSRLQALYHNQYLDRPREQIQRHQSGSKPMVYGLGNKGADLLAEKFKIPRAKVDWTSKNRTVQTFFLDHALEVSNFMVCLELACRQNGNISIIEPEEILARAPAGINGNNPYTLKINTISNIQGDPKKINIGLVPDKVFGLHFKNGLKRKNRAYFFLEADRSTMPIVRKNLFRTSFLKKLLGYYIASPFQENIFFKTFGFKHARVLTVTKSEDRIKNMIEANIRVDKQRKGTGLFLFTKTSNIDLRSPQRALENIWIDGKGKPSISLVD